MKKRKRVKAVSIKWLGKVVHEENQHEVYSWPQLSLPYSLDLTTQALWGDVRKGKPAMNEYDSQNLFVDPLKDDNRFCDYRGPVLLAEEIKEYSTTYNLLIASGFEIGKLKGASYSMTPDPEEAWQFNQEGQQEKVKSGTDDIGDYFLVTRNSLVYIRVLQTLCLPYYIIGRHNLKITYAYQGLLLGTGPQVDPGYRGQLYIPLHNLTNRDVKVYIKKSFVSIDFVRTSSPIYSRGIPRSRAFFARDYPEKRPIEREKIEKRNTLTRYLEGKTPSSSLRYLVKDLKRTQEIFETKAWQRRFDFAVIAAIALTILGVIGGFYWHLDNKIFDHDEKLAVLEQKIDNIGKK